MTGAALKRLEELTRSLGQASAPRETVRIAEALVFAATEPMTEAELAARLPAGTDVPAVMAEIAASYSHRGIHLAGIGGGWAFRTAPDLAFTLARDVEPIQKLSRAALEVLAIIAYHQPATRADIEEVRGVATSKGTLDTLLETGWIRLRGRRRSPGRPLTYGTTPAFLNQFGLDAISDLPGLDELKSLGMLDGRIPPDLAMPTPSDADALAPDEDPLEPDLGTMTPYGAEEG